MYGKDSQKVRPSVQKRDLSGNRKRFEYRQRDLSCAPVARTAGIQLDIAVSERRASKTLPRQTCSARARERKTQGKNRRTHHDGGLAKKNGKFKKPAEKREIARDHVKEFGSVSAACRALGLSKSSYYYQPKKRLETATSEADMRDLIEQVQLEYPFYGYRRIYAHIKHLRGTATNRKTILRIMRKYGLKALIWRGFKVKTTDSEHNYGYAPNLLPGMALTGINQVWVTDITYIRIKTGFVYLSVIMDLYSRKVVGWAISKNIDAKLCLSALEAAIEERRPMAGLVHHSDRGVQYACHEYRKRLEDYEIAPSMSAKGYCYDNAFMESWFKTLKAEEVYLTEYETVEDVLKNVPHFIEVVYNPKRLHSSLGYLSPVEFEALAAMGQLEKRGIQPVMRLR